MTLPLKLRELNVAEQRYRAVVEVLSGTPVIEVAGHITVGDGIAVTAPRKTSRDIKRHKASSY